MTASIIIQMDVPNKQQCRMNNLRRCATLIVVFLVLLDKSFHQGALKIIEAAGTGAVFEDGDANIDESRTANKRTLGFTFRDSPLTGSATVSVSQLVNEPQNDNVRRILVKEVDADGNTIKLQPTYNLEQKFREAIEHLMSDPSFSMPIHRSARIYSSPSSVSSASSSSASLQQKWLPTARSKTFGEGTRLGLSFSDEPQQAELQTFNNNNNNNNGSPLASFPLSFPSSEPEQGLPNMISSKPSPKYYPAKSRKSSATRPRQSELSGASVSAPTPFYQDPLTAIASNSRKQAAIGHGDTNSLASSFPRRMTNIDSFSPALMSGSGPTGLLLSQATTSSRQNHNQLHHHKTGTEEVALPIHSHSSNDYEWKRLENSRWNNLRGMWGKRSISERDSFDDRFKEFNEAQLDEARKMLHSSSSNYDASTGAEAARSANGDTFTVPMMAVANPSDGLRFRP